MRKAGPGGKNMDTDDTNMVDWDKKRNLLALGDDFGQVVMYEYPCTNTKDKGKIYDGHSSHVTNVKFNNPDGETSTHLISAGGHDLSVMQWRIEDEDAGDEDSRETQRTTP